ncbi:LLM class flavin-dependent oxidoreductase [Mycolicibacterium mucogenicum]|uniref:LLM class flavin-dependent oxidoreductase n=1 Tax=Mycolicibacterium mucogenicum TaxID=56689 RepID=UPI00076A8025|nr:LLM class flavin-dependent oxidoreductase [Mycolicibacterium mucogenicum]
MSPKFAVVAPVAAGVTADPVWMTKFARHLESCGFESIVAVEHTVLLTEYSSVYPYDASGRVDIPADCAVPDPLELLTFLAGQTSTLGLATGVLVLPNHHPEEIEACGAQFDERGRRADEQIDVLRLLWSDQPGGATHSGEFFQFAHAACYPKPVSPISIHIGGHSRAAARRAGRRGDGLQPLGVAGAELSGLIALMRESAERAGRDPVALELSLGHLVSKVDADRAGRLAELGADRIVLAMPPVTDIDEAKDMLSACAERLGLTPCP